MTEPSVLALILVVIWGALYVLFLQRTQAGRFLAARLTRLSVVISNGVNIVLCRLFVSGEEWLLLAGVFALSGMPVIAHSLSNELRDTQGILKHVKPNADRE